MADNSYPPFPVVYFIQAGEAGPVKIGYSSSVGDRIGDLQVANYEQLYLRAVVEDGVGTSLEWKISERFKDSLIRGEWYWPTIDLRRFMWENVWPRREPRNPLPPDLEENPF